MRNLVLSATTITSFDNLNISATAIDLDEDVIYATSERLNPDGDVEVEVWKVEDGETSPNLFGMFTAIASPHNPDMPQVVSFHVLPEARKLSAIMRTGDITMNEVEGTVEPGILAASWSPDDQLLVLVTAEDKLMLLTSTFDVFSEGALHAAEFGEDAPINVGWGSKQTQFHGSLGKSAAQAPVTTAIGSSPDDDTIPRISWRGDGAFFVVSALAPAVGNDLRRRTFRVYNREAALQSTSEPVAGLEHPLVWRPSGNLIVGTQRFGFEGGGAGREGRHDVVFFERNGLRHGDFGIRASDLGSQRSEHRKWGYKVRELSWSSDSNVLALWIERDEGDVVQLWTMGNYHWYLKQEITAPSSSTGEAGRFTSVAWHPEQALEIFLTMRTQLIQRTYAWETFVSTSQPPIDSGAVAVFDGTTILLTPFRIQNVPPPMSSCQLVLSTSSSEPQTPAQSRTPTYASFSSASDTLAVLWESGYVELWALRTRLQGGRGKAMDPTRVWAGHAGGLSVKNARQIWLSSSDAMGVWSTLVVLWGDRDSDFITVLQLEDFKPAGDATTVALPHQNSRLVSSTSQISCQAPNGEISEYDSEQRKLQPVAQFPESCLQSQSIIVSSSSDDEDGTSSATVYVGLSASGKLLIASADTTRTLASNVTSYTIASGFVIFTTTAHEAIFIPQTALRPLLDEAEGVPSPVQKGWEVRRVERGSRIVVAVPSAMSLVLQMPRGNLETINPRPLVMEVVKQDIDAGNYRKAFFACRKHRIDLNVLVDHDQTKFLERIPSFVEQVHEVDHINLFLTGLGRGSQSPEMIARLCDAIRTELESKDLTKYVNSILTAHVVKTPPDHESALAILLRLREHDSDVVEDAVKYIIFLVDADRLFDTALGMYDFSLVLMIAQHAQKDPREYLPFLRDLRTLDKYYQRFKIDDHLRRYDSALRNLSLAGPEYFDEAIAYVELHRLYDAALRIWKGTDHYKTVLDLYGDWLFERREFRQAASVFIEAQNFSKAMLAHEKALEWQELFYLAAQTDLPEEDLVSTAYRIAEDLASKKRHSEAARVLLDYAKDVREAIIALVQGNYFSEARRIVTIQEKPELIEDIIHPGALESCAQVVEDINECKDQLRKQVNRLRELRIKKVEEPDAFYGTEDINLHNVDVMTDVSMAPTTFTRYTVAPTTASRSSKRSSRSKRKMERKVGSGRKGTVDEEEYLLKSVTKLTTRFATIQANPVVLLDEARGLLPHLLQFTPEHRQEGLEMQKYLFEFETELKTSLEEIWFRPAEEVPVDSWATRMEEVDMERKTNPIDKVPKPELPSGNGGWRLNLFDF
ncbi:Elongator complex protein 1 [Hypsizygus marmoreus]|uniref:Elongator complex protein 1 n=1 Tax=Hypsizygus marmoreus TaxID=39966 RepID=A0A369JWZ0_HYPMA|nr:Elongator complex protein 1 [Hypsizygus marmoreus]